MCVQRHPEKFGSKPAVRRLFKRRFHAVIMPAVRSKRTKNVFKFFAVNKHSVTADAAVKFRMRKRAGKAALGVNKASSATVSSLMGQSAQIHIG